jgi:hypothetical protein
MSATAVRFWSSTAFLLAVVLSLIAGLRQPLAEGQEAKRYVYKVVDVPTDNNAMQTTLNEYGAAGWELIAMSMGDLTAPRMVFKK